jgi:hypothetical protein
VWELGNDREDFKVIRQYLAADTIATDVLEIGCYTGILLQSLPKRLRLHGVEIVAGSTAELPL